MIHIFLEIKNMVMIYGYILVLLLKKCEDDMFVGVIVFSLFLVKIK